MTGGKSKTRGFKRTSSLLQGQIRQVSETRGFAQSRVLTHWADIVGEDTAAIARPVDVSFGRQGMGATLTILTTGSQAPMLDMQKEKLREKVNAVYGYNAISRIRITQTAATGFAEGQVSFDHRPTSAPKTKPAPGTRREAEAMTADVDDTSLRMALEALGQNVLSKSKR